MVLMCEIGSGEMGVGGVKEEELGEDAREEEKSSC